mgnify:CR=1 FL=1
MNNKTLDKPASKGGMISEIEDCRGLMGAVFKISLGNLKSFNLQDNVETESAAKSSWGWLEAEN